MNLCSAMRGEIPYWIFFSSSSKDSMFGFIGDGIVSRSAIASLVLSPLPVMQRTSVPSLLIRPDDAR